MGLSSCVAVSWEWVETVWRSGCVCFPSLIGGAQRRGFRLVVLFLVRAVFVREMNLFGKTRSLVADQLEHPMEVSTLYSHWSPPTGPDHDYRIGHTVHRLRQV